jgi:hypothetical protein
MLDEENIYKLKKMHEYLSLKGGDCVMRVPGGWIYSIYTSDTLSCVFVPYNNEFDLC